MKDEWKRIEFDYKRFPCINLRYVVRVFLWRFFEISSRVALLCLVWMNLGGIYVFLMMGIEIYCLIIISYGFGTLSFTLFL